MTFTVAQLFKLAEPIRHSTLKARNRLGYTVAAVTCLEPYRFNIILLVPRGDGTFVDVLVRASVPMAATTNALDALTEQEVLDAVSDRHLAEVGKNHADAQALMAAYYESKKPKYARFGWLHAHVVETMIACTCTSEQAHEILNHADVDWSEMSTKQIRSSLRDTKAFLQLGV